MPFRAGQAVQVTAQAVQRCLPVAVKGQGPARPQRQGRRDGRKAQGDERLFEAQGAPPFARAFAVGGGAAGRENEQDGGAVAQGALPRRVGIITGGGIGAV
ncbi:hypothetical protein RZS08_08455, partial [Arthrospira platensis SPKY1]|nr:hypothetical protein [Arthrospira platensis SPKY1]